MPTLVSVDYDPFEKKNPLTGEKSSWDTIKDWLPTTWPARMAREMWSAAQLPGDVAAGRVDPNSQEGFERAQALAGFLAGGRFPAPGEGLGMGAGGKISLGGKSAEEVAKAKTKFKEETETILKSSKYVKEPKGIFSAQDMESFIKKWNHFEPTGNPGLEALLTSLNFGEGKLTESAIKSLHDTVKEEFGKSLAPEALDYLKSNFGLSTSTTVFPTAATDLISNAFVIGKTKSSSALDDIEKEINDLLEGKTSLPLPQAEKPIPYKLIAEAIRPMDWQNYGAGPSSATQWKAMGNELGAKLEGAEQAGFNLNVPLYKGMEVDLAGGKFWDPKTKPNERALFFADHPEVANAYAATKPGELTQITGPQGENIAVTAPNVGAYYARPKNPFEVDWREINPYGASYNGKIMQNLLEHVRYIGGDAVVIKNIADLAETNALANSQTQYAILHPELVRSKFAKFDPTRLGENDLLATQGGFPFLVPVDHDPFAGEKK